jgi:ribosomal protein L34E
VAGRGALRHAALRSRMARSQFERTEASKVENMYLRFTSRWFVNETCKDEFGQVRAARGRETSERRQRTWKVCCMNARSIEKALLSGNP